MAAGRMHPPSMFVDRVFAVLGPTAQIHVNADGTLLRSPDASQNFAIPKKHIAVQNWPPVLALMN